MVVLLEYLQDGIRILKLKDKRSFKKRFVAIVVIAHVIVVGLLLFLASKEGILGTKMQSLTVSLVPKEKIEIPKPRSVEEKKIEIPQPIIPKIEVPTEQPVAKIDNVAPAIAPPPSEEASIQFSDGAKEVITSSDPIQLYKAYVEGYLKVQWNRPEKIDGEVQTHISIDNNGKILSTKLQIGSNSQWNQSIIDLFSKVNSFPKPPPKGFPLTFDIRFDTIEEQ